MTKRDLATAIEGRLGLRSFQGRLCHLEHGNGNWSVELLLAAAGALDVAVTDLLKDLDAERPAGAL